MGTPAPGKEVEIDLDNLHPSQVPELGASEAIKWLPFIAKIIDGVRQAIATGSFSVPTLVIRVFGHRLAIGPVPIALKD